MKNHKKNSFHNYFRLLMIMGIVIASLISLAIFFYLLPQPQYTTGFETIRELEALAAARDEWIKMEGINPLIPSYEKYYASQLKKTWGTVIREKIRWLGMYCNLVPAPHYSPSYFKRLLETVVKQRLAQKWQGDFIQKIQMTPQSKIISFGVLQGAFHSFTRCLRELQRQNILDENFKVTNNEYYITLNGNVINRTPYTLQMLTTVLKLMEVNPNNVFYLRGEQEYFDEWHFHTLKRELELFCGDLSKKGIPLKDEIEAFFGTLPLALYCTIPFQKTKRMPFFRINPFFTKKYLNDQINEALYAHFIKKEVTGIATMNLSEETRKPQENVSVIDFKAMITDIRKRDSWEMTDGLRQLPPINGVTAWHIFSSPTQIFRDYFNFYWDAFVVITPGAKLDAWTITLHHHDIKSNDSSFSTRSHNFFKGA